MDLARDIYKDLLRWKQQDTGRVLELSGARQVGKTYIIEKFSKENYKNHIYINMMQTSGSELLRCIHKASEWEPGEMRIERPLHRAFELFQSDFQDIKETIIVIDEIQESAEIYSLIRQFAREFQCHFIVTGSYLGKTLDKAYFLPAGDIDTLTMETLSFEEFLEAVGLREKYAAMDLYGGSPHEDYDELKRWYDIYTQIGGYPSVVKCYLSTGGIDQCRSELVNIIRIFISESERYFDDVLNMNMFDEIFPAIAQTMIKEKKGSGDLITELSNIIFKTESSRITKKSINQAIAWLYRSNIIGYCHRLNECNLLDISYHNGFYFRDLGLTRYFLTITGADPGTIQGIVAENYVYLCLERQIRNMRIAGTAPAFGVYKGGEIDFFVRSLATYKNYAIEVKAGKNVGKTANVLLDDQIADYVYLLRGDTYGGVTDRKFTIPIYLSDRITFDAEP